ncbi:MAG: hypothetical protein ABI910_12990, partial [Gemmatimonadota bacterium]
AHPEPRAGLLTILLASMLAFPATGIAQARWEEIGQTRSGNPVFVDRRTVKTGSDGIINATIRVAYVKPVKTPKGDLTASRASAMFDCAKMTFAAKDNATYIDEKRNIVFQRTVNKIPGFGPAIVGNFADVALQHFCKK